MQQETGQSYMKTCINTYVVQNQEPKQFCQEEWTKISRSKTYPREAKAVIAAKVCSINKLTQEVQLTTVCILFHLPLFYNQKYFTRSMFIHMWNQIINPKEIHFNSWL